jgi:hypothetical protein
MNEEELKKQKDQAYWERNQLVAALSKIFPAWLGRHDPQDKEWDREWLNIVFIEVPTRRIEMKMIQGGFDITGPQQLSWHIHDNELEHFSHLEYSNKKKWDGHTTEEKYQRLRNIVKRKKFLGLF